MRGIPPDCCARAASGNADAPPSSVMNSHRLIDRPLGPTTVSFLLMTAAPLHALARDESAVPPPPIAASQATARDHARDLSEMAHTAAGDSAKCRSSGAALGSQAYKECRALLGDKMSIENDFPPDRSYARG